MKRYFVGFTVAAALVQFSGCATTASRAKDLYEKGDYEAAEKTYEDAVAENPKDTNAVAGLQSARSKVLDTRLIQVRKTREAGSDTSSSLMAILDLEAKWQMQPPGAAVFTQKEEIDAETASILSHVNSAENSPFPLRQELELTTTELLFQQSSVFQYRESLTKIEAQGAKECLSYVHQMKPAQVYLTQFVAKFCAFWHQPATIKNNTLALNRNLYSQIRPAIQLQNYPQGSEAEISTRLDQGLRASAWYSSGGAKVLDVAISGSWNQNLQKTATLMLFPYDEQESYVDQESVMKTRQVPHTVFENTIDPLTGMPGAPEVRTVWDSETYWDTEPVTRWRTVQKTFPYGGWSLFQTLSIAFDMTGDIFGQSLRISLHDESHTQDTASDISNPAIGLQPKLATLIPDPTAWLLFHEVELSRQLKERFDTAWANLYCSDVPANDFAVSGDQVQKCLSSSAELSAPPKFADAWYQTHLGVTVQDAVKLLNSPRP